MKIGLKCEGCLKTFSTRAAARSHQLRKNKVCKKRVECEKCGERYKGKLYQKHILKMHGAPRPDGTFEDCFECEKWFRTKEELAQHTARMHNKRCKCDHKAPKKGILNKHIKVKHEGIRVICQLCEAKFVSMANLKVHTRNIHDDVRHPCNQCDYSATQIQGLCGHQKVKHQGLRYECDLCEFTSTDKSYIQLHKETKHENRKHSCDKCEFIANHPSGLNGHVKNKHEETSTYNCDKCAKHYSGYDGTQKLQRHKDAIHNGLMIAFVSTKSLLEGVIEANVQELYECKEESLSGSALVECLECEETFANSVNLKTHMNEHTGKGSFKCEECDKTFPTFETLRTHMILHSGELLFQCNNYEKKYAQKGNLTEADLKYSDEKCFNCIECGKTFKSQESLQYHMRSVHNVGSYHSDTRPSQSSVKSVISSRLDCRFCHKQFVKQELLKAHEESVHKFEKDVERTARIHKAPTKVESDLMMDDNSLDDKAEALAYLMEGESNLLCKDIPTAMSCSPEACKLMSAEEGDKAPKCRETFYFYDEALLELAGLGNVVLGNAFSRVPDDDEATKDDFEKKVMDVDDKEKVDGSEVEEQTLWREVRGREKRKQGCATMRTSIFYSLVID